MIVYSKKADQGGKTKLCKLNLGTRLHDICGFIYLRVSRRLPNKYAFYNNNNVIPPMHTHEDVKVFFLQCYSKLLGCLRKEDDEVKRGVQLFQPHNDKIGQNSDISQRGGGTLICSNHNWELP
jgi:hypothetical protein